MRHTIAHVDSFPDELNEFWQGLSTIRGSRLNERARRRIDYCQTWLERLSGIGTSSDEESDLGLRVTRAHVLLELASELSHLGENDAATSHMQDALVEAELSRDEQTIYNSLVQIAMYHYQYGDPDSAVVYLQRSLVYGRVYWPSNLKNTLDSLARIWSRNDETLPVALAMYDWICQIDHAPLSTLMDKYGCLLTMGRVDEVKQEASRSIGQDAASAGPIVAALWTLRKRSKARKVAEEGLRIAQESNDRLWANAYEWFLARSS